MSQAPPPSPEMIREVTPPWWRTKTAWTVILSLCAVAPVLADIFVPLLTPDQATKFIAVAGALAAVAAKFGRDGGVEASAVVLRKTRNESGRHLQ